MLFMTELNTFGKESTQMNKRKLERQYQCVLKKNEALKGALINCALQLKITLIRHGEDMSLGQNQWYSDFIEYAEKQVGHKLPTVVSFDTDEILEQGEVVHQRFEEYFQLRGSSTGRLTIDDPIPQSLSQDFSNLEKRVLSKYHNTLMEEATVRKDVDGNFPYGANTDEN